MKYSMRLLTVGVLPAALSGCATGLNLSSLHSQSRQTTYFDSSEMPSHSTETSYRQEATIFQLPDLSKDASLQQCLIYAALKSPALEAAFHDWRAAILRVPQVNSLPDPRLSLGYFLEEIQTRTGPMEQQLSLQQSFPWWGLLEAKGDVATAAAQKKWRDYESVRLAIFEQVALRWSSLVDLDSEIRVVEESFDLLAESERIALRSYEVDETGHDKLVRLQVELGKLEDNLQRLRDLQMPRLASLNATLARSSTGPLALPSSIELHSSSMTLEQARELLINNPSVEGLDALILQHEKATEVAILDAKPKWTVGLTYTNLGAPLDPTAPDAGDNPLMGMVGFSIPLNQEKYDAAKQEALSKRTATLAKR
nr:TolC family protein [PVC group bacterium]